MFTLDREKLMEYDTMPEAILAVVESMPDGQFFFGNELQNAVAEVYPPARTVYISSILQAMRRKCGDMVRCVDHNDSLYQKIGYQRLAS